jgi:hypothetical protein
LAGKQCNFDVMKTLARHLDAYITGTPLPAPKQGVEQRVEILPAKRVSNNAHSPASPQHSKGEQHPSNTPGK